MKTVIIDKSLCSFPLAKNARPEFILHYIEALAESGVDYVELDYDVIEKNIRLPNTVKYIYRVNDISDALIAKAGGFRYAVMTKTAIDKGITVDVPIILELAASQEITPDEIWQIQNKVNGIVAMVRLRGSFMIDSLKDAHSYIVHLRRKLPIPVDFCPMDRYRTALDTAIKLSRGGADSITMTMGIHPLLASIEEYMFTLMSVYESKPKGFDVGAVCKAAVYHQLVFGGGFGDSIYRIMQLLDYDISHLRNVDTGKRVPLKVSLKDHAMLKRKFVSTLRGFMESEDIPEDFAYDISETIRKFDLKLFDEKMLSEYPKTNLQ